MKLGIGTAQFGLDYGVLNTEGQTHPDEVRRILSFATEQNIRMLDTAASYGSSEQVLGELAFDQTRFDVVTKLPSFDRREILEADADDLEASVHASLARLKRDSLYGLLVHRATDLFVKGAERLIRRMQDLQHEGLIGKIGLSVYNAEEIDRCLDLFVPDLVQLPVSVIDRRLVHSGHLAKLKRLGAEIHARSIFLQGLLLIPSRDLPPIFDPHRAELQAYHDLLAAHGVTPLRAAIGYVNSLQDVDVAICGVNNLDHLKQIVQESRAELDISAIPSISIDDPQILNPSNWFVQQ